jgi:hypothetical protein
MNRVDTKFVFNKNKLEDLLSSLKNHYDILDINNQRIHSYKSLYYDTVDNKFFIHHHNGRVNRNKVRFREYVGSGLSFLEVKTKNNKGKTNKKRIKVDSIGDSLSKHEQDYIESVIGNKLELESKQWVCFDRFTLVDKDEKERLTIDTNIMFSDSNNSGSFENIVIAELKQDKLNNSSNFKRLAKNMYISPSNLSKYCLSTISLKRDIKQNRFKEKLLLLNKLKQQ